MSGLPVSVLREILDEAGVRHSHIKEKSELERVVMESQKRTEAQGQANREQSSADERLAQLTHAEEMSGGMSDVLHYVQRDSDGDVTEHSDSDMEVLPTRSGPDRAEERLQEAQRARDASTRRRVPTAPRVPTAQGLDPSDPAINTTGPVEEILMQGIVDFLEGVTAPTSQRAPTRARRVGGGGNANGVRNLSGGNVSDETADVMMRHLGALAGVGVPMLLGPEVVNDNSNGSPSENGRVMNVDVNDPTSTMRAPTGNAETTRAPTRAARVSTTGRAGSATGRARSTSGDDEAPSDHPALPFDGLRILPNGQLVFFNSSDSETDTHNPFSLSLGGHPSNEIINSPLGPLLFQPGGLLSSSGMLLGGGLGAGNGSGRSRFLELLASDEFGRIEDDPMSGFVLDHEHLQHLINRHGGGGAPAGAAAETITQLPTGSANANDGECMICLDQLSTTTHGQVKTLPCLHRFHEGCVDRWLHMNDTCPVCKTSIS